MSFYCEFCNGARAITGNVPPDTAWCDCPPEMRKSVVEFYNDATILRGQKLTLEREMVRLRALVRSAYLEGADRYADDRVSVDHETGWKYSEAKKELERQ